MVAGFRGKQPPAAAVRVFKSFSMVCLLPALSCLQDQAPITHQHTNTHHLPPRRNSAYAQRIAAALLQQAGSPVPLEEQVRPSTRFRARFAGCLRCKPQNAVLRARLGFPNHSLPPLIHTPIPSNIRTRPPPPTKQVVILFAIQNGYADQITPEETPAWMARAVQWVRQVRGRAGCGRWSCTGQSVEACLKFGDPV